MPKTEIDYGNTIIYKIYCKDTGVKDLFVGYTTNFVQKKYAHKQCCSNTNSLNYPLYKVIRENGGWDNWIMEMVDFFNCKNQYEARIKEQEFIISLHATLNNIDSGVKYDIKEKPSNIIISSNVCNNDLQNAKLLKEYKKKQDENIDFYCEICDFNCNKRGDYNRHMSTSKHVSNATQMMFFATKKPSNYIKLHQSIISSHECDKCGKSYNSRSGLWRHNKICTENQNSDDESSHENKIYESQYNTVKLSNVTNNGTNNGTTGTNDGVPKDAASIQFFMNLFYEQMNENKEVKDFLIEQNKQMMNMMSQNQYITTNNINSHNKTTNNQFNLQFFLNETCKDAMNIDEFIDYVKVKTDDFENFGQVGYPKAVSDIIVRNLNELDVRIRPIHCSDLKREVLYIKHDGVWHNDEKRHFMKRSIMYVANKNIKQIPKWQELNPESKNCHTKTFDKYNKLCRASLGAATDEEEADFLKKITSIVAKEVVIDKKKKY